MSRDVPLRAQRSLTAGKPTAQFNLVGLHWRGAGTVQFRTRSLAGRWSSWVDAAPEAEDRPDAGTDERARLSSWRLGNPWWVGASDRIEYRLRGKVTRLRAYFVWSPPAGVPARTLQKAGAPAIVPRSGWNADERIRRSTPSFAPAIRLALVHHTAGANGYTAAQSPSIVRAIELYHVKGNGWNDIGYNFLVDRFGNVYEGRGGGIEKNVIGAHSEGFNTGTFGVALIGNYAHATPPKAQQTALVDLLAWRLDVAHVDPLSTVVYTSGGNAKFRSGKNVILRAISGHRDTGPSECPGTGTYVLLPGIAKRVSLTGLPKLYSPSVTGAAGGPIRIQARLSSSLPWTVTVVDQLGRTVASGSGTGTAINWTWNSLVAGKGSFTWTIDSPGARPATGTIGIGRPVPAPTLSLTNLATTPSVITPNADGSADSMTVSFTLGTASLVTAQVL
ncbi:MAG: hypothetical protein QOF45_1558, partial [Gaiellaceae bacterium]|nr:hypothetical protein [Gaiellaceae bacterium]